MTNTTTPGQPLGLGLSDQLGMLPTPPNEAGATMCTVRWMVETTAGWLGSWERGAFDAYIAAAVAAERARWESVVSNAVIELEALDDETADVQSKALRALMLPNVEANRAPVLRPDEATARRGRSG